MKIENLENISFRKIKGPYGASLVIHDAKEHEKATFLPIEASKSWRLYPSSLNKKYWSEFLSTITCEDLSNPVIVEWFEAAAYHEDIKLNILLFGADS